MWRDDFPQLRDGLVYLDTAATALKPRAVIDAIANFYANDYATVHRGVYPLSLQASERYQEVREKVARFLNAKPSQIVFTKGTTDSINLVANSIHPGDRVLITPFEHHSNIVPWQLAGAKLDFTLHPKTKLVSIAHIANSVGTVQPIEEIIEQAHAVGAKVLIDAAQSAAHLPLDVQKLDCDFLAFSGHKLYGPTGIGILYGKDLHALPPYQGGGDMIARVTLEKTTYNEPPLKFEAGTPNIAGVIGLGAALDYLPPLPEIMAHEQELLSYALPKLQHLQILGNPTANIISFTIDGIHPLDLGTLLGLQNIAIRTGHQCAQPTMDHFGITSLSRISFGLYNTKEDIDHFLTALKEVLLKL